MPKENINAILYNKSYSFESSPRLEVKFNEDVVFHLGDVLVLESKSDYSSRVILNAYIIRKEQDGEDEGK